MQFIEAIGPFTQYFLVVIVAGIIARVLYHNAAQKEVPGKVDKWDEDKEKWKKVDGHVKKPSARSKQLALAAATIGIVYKLIEINFILGPVQRQRVYDLAADLHLVSFGPPADHYYLTQAFVTALYAVFGYVLWEVGGGLLGSIKKGASALLSLKAIALVMGIGFVLWLMFGYGGANAQTRDTMEALGTIGVIALGAWLYLRKPGGSKGAAKGGSSH